MVRDNGRTYKNIEKVDFGQGGGYSSGSLLDWAYFRNNITLLQ